MSFTAASSAEDHVLARSRWPGGQLIDAWYRNEQRAVWIMLGCFVVVWTTYHCLANASIGLHTDNLEMFVWSRHPQAGYSSHPPLAAWIVAAWFAVFPTTDWAYNLLAMLNAAAALFAIDLIARRYLSGDKRLLVLLLLLLTPFYQIRAQRYGANLILLWTWPLAAYCFLRAFETRRLDWSSAAGAAAALAMLAKYYSVYLIAGFILGAIVHPDRWKYARSSSPWVSMLAGFLLLAPHLVWLASSGFQPFDYALREHAGSTLGQAFWKAAIYAIQGAAYMLLPIAVFWLSTRTRPQALLQSFWPPQPELRMLAVLLWTPLVLPLLTAPIMGAELTPLWTMQAWFLLPILLLIPNDVIVPRSAAIKISASVIVVTAAMLIAAPALAVFRTLPSGMRLLKLEDYRATEQAVAAHVTTIWREATGRPLTIVAGWWNMPSYAVTFYSPDHPDSIVAYPHTAATSYDLSKSPWITPERLKREGWLAVCPITDDECHARTSRFVADGPQPKRVEFEVVTTFWGWSRSPARYVAYLSLPKAEN